MECIKGFIDHFIHRNEENGFSVLELNSDNEKITCVGILNGFAPGENVEIQGEYTEHAVYGRQIKIKSIKALPPEDRISVMRYLGSGAIKGIGESLAKRIVDYFGDDTFRIAENEPERLAEVKGISLKKAYDIGNQLAQKRDARDSMIFLQQFGISQKLSNKIYQKYGNEIYRVIKENPYRLVEDIEGVGFKIADDIAIKAGIDVSSAFRIRSAVIYALLEASYEGHCYYPLEELTDRVSLMLSVERMQIPPVVKDLAIDRKILVKNVDGKDVVYSPSFYYEEQGIAMDLFRLSDYYDSSFTEISREKWFKRIEEIEKRENIKLDILQKNAVYECMVNGIFILSGGPGTGKTTTINVILKLFEEENLSFELAAPTGRAAKRMQETTGYEAKTIHRLLEINGEIKEQKKINFERNEENPLDGDAIIIDEMSMVDVHLFRALLKAVEPGAKLILIGDVNQLPAVGPGQVLKDIIESKMIKSVHLEKIYRQGEGSHIVTNAHKINKGEPLTFEEKYRDFFLLEKNDYETIYRYILELMEVNIPRSFNITPFDVEVLTPMRKGALGTIALNSLLQSRLNKPDASKLEYTFGNTLFREGDKVMQIKNNYNIEWRIIGKYNIPVDKGMGIYNGDIGRIESINNYSKTMVIKFDENREVDYPFELLDELELAYAMTVHKSQGGEYPVVIMPLLSGPPVLFTKNLLYTGVTRGTQSVIILGMADTVNSMIKNDRIEERYTSLRQRIISAFNDAREV